MTVAAANSQNTCRPLFFLSFSTLSNFLKFNFYCIVDFLGQKGIQNRTDVFQ